MGVSSCRSRNSCPSGISNGRVPVTAAARRNYYISGMIDRDNGVRPSSSARDAPADFMAVLGGNDNRYTAAESTRPGCRLKAHSHGELGGIPIVESDVLILDRRAFGGDGFGVAGLVVLVTRRGVFSGDGEASPVIGDF